MRRELMAGLGLLWLGLSSGLVAKVQYERDVNIITTNYDLVDTTYIDRGRIDGVKVGDTYKVNFRDGKLATKVVVTGVFDRMASVKIVDNWLLKDGQLANFNQRSMLAGVDSKERRPAPDIKIGQKAAEIAPGMAAVPPAAPEAPGVPDLGGPPPAAPEAPGAPATDPGLPPAPPSGLPDTPATDPGLPPAPPTGLPDAPPDTGLPDAPPPPDAGGPPPPDAGGAPPSDGGAPPPPDMGGPPDGAPPPPPPPSF